MAIIEIIHLDIESQLAASSPSTAVDNTVRKATETLSKIKPPQPFVFGTQVQDKGTIQITSELDAVQDNVDLETIVESSSFIKALHNACGEPRNIFHVDLSRSAFGPDGLATANVIECVQNYFPASRVTPEFQKRIEKDFLKFDEIYSKGAKGNLSWASGWVLEEQEHRDIKGEKAKCFFVIRGWESMDHFEESLKNDAYKEAIPLLFAWNAPWKMVSPRFAPTNQC
ncbi:hypothetical protein F5884DRAFT_668383 [Xylogone sp. PMI_703]|nr:hypothetical protein F5884DRAFT_668383 [Xylogone sp. PMI_703]